MASRFKGYMGNMLEIDLTEGVVRETDVTDKEREMFIGGKGLAAKILFDRVKPGIDPLSPENMLIFNTGPLTGSNAPCSSRFNCTTKNVLTGGIASSNCGGNFGLNLKKAGYDALILTGKAKNPVHISIEDNKVEIKDATSLWGLTTGEAQKRLDPKAGKMVIGPAGENLVKYACIISGERALGRCGVGAVMGSKNVKAVTAKGTRKIEAFNPEGFKKAIQGWIKLLKAHPTTGESLPAYGTAGMVNTVNLSRCLPTENFSKGHFDDAEKISGETLAEEHLVKNTGCVSCPIRCARVVKVGEREVKGPEFETVGLFGSNIGNNDLGLINEWNLLMDELGIDTISAGGAVAFAMELTRNGIIDSELKFGRSDNIAQTLEDIAHRRGIGDDLAEGVMRMSEKYGGKGYAIHSKGLELASYDPRNAVGQGLGYATANRGGCHLNAGYLIFFERIGPINMNPHSTGAKPAFVVFQQNTFEAVSSSGICLFTTYAIIPPVAHRIKKHGLVMRMIQAVLNNSGPVMNYQSLLLPHGMAINLPSVMPHPHAISKLTGMKMNMGRFLLAGERDWNIERLFNLREGFTSDDDNLPERLLEDLEDASNPKSRVPLSKMIPRYYKIRGWSNKGIPAKRRLKKLGLLKQAGFLKSSERLTIRR